VILSDTCHHGTSSSTEETRKGTKSWYICNIIFITIIYSKFNSERFGIKTPGTKAILKQKEIRMENKGKN